MAEEEELDEGQGIAPQDNRKMKRVPLRERSRQWFLTLGTVLALLATIIGFLSDSVGVLEFLQNSDPSPEPAESAAAKIALERLVTDTPMPTQTPMPTPTTAVSPTATPMPVIAAENERLLIVAQFANFAADANYNVAGRIHEALSEQVEAARLEDTRVEIWPDIVEDNTTASGIVSTTGAALMIWGEYDSGRVRVRFTLAGGGAELDWQRLLGTPSELSTTINLDVPRETQALALITLGRVYRNAGDLTRARAAFAQALAQQPSDEETVATLTFYLAILDAAATPPALDRAIEGYTKVIALRPQWHNARYNRGLAYLTRYWHTAEATNLDNAIDDFTATLEVRSSYVEAYINRSIAYYARNGDGDLDASIDDLSDAIRFNPKSYRAFYNRGLTYIRLDRQERWVIDLNKALEIAPEFWVSHHALCWGYALDEMPEQGLPHCDEAVKHDSEGSTLDGRGLIMVEMDRMAEATADLEKYIEWLDTQPEVWSELSNRHIYENILEGLRAGENRVTPELLEQLR
jgi:tetratricopeptide (TPR) repeat protein